VDGDDLERDVQGCKLWSAGEPVLRGPANAALLLGANHLGRVAEVLSRPHLDLAEDEPGAAADDEVELVPPTARIGVENPVTAQPVVAADTALGRAPYDNVACSTRARASSSDR